MIAVDSSVLLDLLDLLGGDPRFADASEAGPGLALEMGEVVVCDAVVADVQTLLDTHDTAMDKLALMGVRYLPTSEVAAVRAGHMQRRFRDRGGRRDRVVADFLIGAHAVMQFSNAATRQRGNAARSSPATPLSSAITSKASSPSCPRPMRRSQMPRHCTSK